MFVYLYNGQLYYIKWFSFMSKSHHGQLKPLLLHCQVSTGDLTSQIKLKILGIQLICKHIKNETICGALTSINSPNERKIYNQGAKYTQRDMSRYWKHRIGTRSCKENQVEILSTKNAINVIKISTLKI